MTDSASTTRLPSMTTIVYAVTDLDAANAAFTTVLADPHTDQPYYVGWNVAGVDVALDPNGHRKGLAGPLPYWTVADIAASRDALVAAGATVVQEPTAATSASSRTLVRADRQLLPEQDGPGGVALPTPPGPSASGGEKHWRTTEQPSTARRAGPCPRPPVTPVAGAHVERGSCAESWMCAGWLAM